MIRVELDTTIYAEVELCKVTVGKTVSGASHERLALYLVLVAMRVSLCGIAEYFGINARQIVVGSVECAMPIFLIVAHEQPRYVMASESLVIVKSQFIKVIIHELVLVEHRNLGIGVDGVLFYHDLLCLLIIFI